jgi:hypothetical protein
MSAAFSNEADERMLLTDKSDKFKWNYPDAAAATMHFVHVRPGVETARASEQARPSP